MSNPGAPEALSTNLSHLCDMRNTKSSGGLVSYSLHRLEYRDDGPSFGFRRKASSNMWR
ncbi:uncharacterized protein METZ01_LOCUS457906, partial [marine metagenome]